ncbi:uncharacterized protein LOC142050789 [Phalacrocorax aristotelis]|uniref:uncharacterized protein LOC142050789 n=1 Tax=Phalacrocorax aristotelis TaxID=126867 RepID=UPI003F4B4FB3
MPALPVGSRARRERVQKRKADAALGRPWAGGRRLQVPPVAARKGAVARCPPLIPSRRPAARCGAARCGARATSHPHRRSRRVSPRRAEAARAAPAAPPRPRAPLAAARRAGCAGPGADASARGCPRGEAGRGEARQGGCEGTAGSGPAGAVTAGREGSSHLPLPGSAAGWALGASHLYRGGGAVEPGPPCSDAERWQGLLLPRGRKGLVPQSLAPAAGSAVAAGRGSGCAVYREDKRRCSEAVPQGSAAGGGRACISGKILCLLSMGDDEGKEKSWAHTFASILSVLCQCFVSCSASMKLLPMTYPIIGQREKRPAPAPPPPLVKKL